MKKIKDIFSVFNLFLFLISFLLYSYNGLSASSTSGSLSQIQKCFVAKSNPGTGDSAQQLSEKNENETENKSNCNTTAFALNFNFSCFHPKVAYTVAVSMQSMVEKNTSPIYISVRNFRI